jgi:hypothetical protein
MWAHLSDGRRQRRIGGIDEPLRLRRDGADAHREGGVAVPTIDDRPTVDRQHVPLRQRSLVGDPVDHLVVHRRADHRREAVVAQEVGVCATPCEHLAADRIERERGDPWLRGGADRQVHLGDHTAGSAHLAQLTSRPARNGATTETRPASRRHDQPGRREASTAVVSRRKTSSVEATPSTIASRPSRW